MATMRKIETHKSVVRTHYSLVDLQVGRTTTETLNIDCPFLRIQAECLKGSSLAGQFNGIDVLITAVVTGTRVAFGVFIRHGRAKSIVHSARCDIL
jgi:hypothetical protein